MGNKNNSNSKSSLNAKLCVFTEFEVGYSKKKNI